MLGTIKKWFIGRGDHQTLIVGSRINTPKGMATVVGGNVIVNLDKPVKMDHPNQRNWTFNLDKLEG